MAIIFKFGLTKKQPDKFKFLLTLRRLEIINEKTYNKLYYVAKER